ncbi:hypothetical protein C10C_0282 [Chlamydia serpentis]|uniref:Uncharacterized protein n=1 Tax=Chlamydia serpentis TaxID=1967782 RepID=A0A2R8FAX5_9CHLA|nr:hypothetical protein [Chlamydia serpentis]SPN73456.1 hypothetical protein C10C_0282 [Chlamydia serpentis]
MTRNIKYFLILFPGILWMIAGIKLLLKAATTVLDPTSSFLIYCPIAMISWGLALLKYHYLLRRTVEKQLILSSEFFAKKTTVISYIKQSFCSKRFLIMITMIVFSLILRRYISNIYGLFIIRATIGYALIKTAIGYFSKLQDNLIKSP